MHLLESFSSAPEHAFKADLLISTDWDLVHLWGTTQHDTRNERILHRCVRVGNSMDEDVSGYAGDFKDIWKHTLTVRSSSNPKLLIFGTAHLLIQDLAVRKRNSRARDRFWKYTEKESGIIFEVFWFLIFTHCKSIADILSGLLRLVSCLGF